MSLGILALMLFREYVEQPEMRRIEKTNPGGKATEEVRDQVKACELSSVKNSLTTSTSYF